MHEVQLEILYTLIGKLILIISVKSKSINIRQRYRQKSKDALFFGHSVHWKRPLLKWVSEWVGFNVPPDTV